MTLKATAYENCDVLMLWCFTDSDKLGNDNNHVWQSIFEVTKCHLKSRAQKPFNFSDSVFRCHVLNQMKKD